MSNRGLSLARSLQRRILLVASLAVVALSALTFVFVQSDTRARTLSALSDWAVERARFENDLFALAEENLEQFADIYLHQYASAPVVTPEQFWSLYERGPDGAVRMRTAWYEGAWAPEGDYYQHVSSFIGNNQPVTDPDLQRRLVLAARLLAQGGAGWISRFANIHATFPENAITLYWPGTPWGRQADADLRMNELGVVESTLQQHNPDREPVWTGLYYDATAGEWMITYQRPVDRDDRHLINPSHDVPLTRMMERLMEEVPDDGHNFIIRSDGYLVAHPSPPGAEQELLGQLSLEEIDNPAITRAWRLIREQTGGQPGSGDIIHDDAGDAYLAVSQLTGPDWWFVTVYPERPIREAAGTAAAFVLLSGMALLALLIVLIARVLQRDAERPLAQLRDAAVAIEQDRHADVAAGRLPLPEQLGNEVGLLARTFRTMARSIDTARDRLESLVRERTGQLEQANARLRSLSLLDGLLGIHNRRAFDHDLQTVFDEARASRGHFQLLLIDVDEFKLFNDTYGHLRGDDALIRLAGCIQDSIRDTDRVYRYGGEELAVILSQPNAREAAAAAERILAEVRRMQLSFPETEAGIVTVSAGLASYSIEHQAPEDLIREADRLLYQAKAGGRNRLCS
ncbi:MAG: diguanylate cyclase [Pseudohongiellaceae bacterium]